MDFAYKMPRKKEISATVTWLSEEIIPEQKSCISFQYYKYVQPLSYRYYFSFITKDVLNEFICSRKFQFKNIVGEIGDFVLISNADSAEPDTEGGCDAAHIIALYEDTTNSNDPFRARVQWYSRPGDLPASCFKNSEPIKFLENEVWMLFIFCFMIRLELYFPH